MKLMFTPAPLSTLASACPSPIVLPTSRVHAVKPAAASPLAAHLIAQPSRVQFQATALPVARTVAAAEQYLKNSIKSTTGKSTTGNGTKFDGTRGVPPRGKPV
jgi:hypothetical protein